MDRAASRIVLISFEASLEACFAMASGVAFEPLGMEAAGWTRGRIFIANFSSVMLCMASLTLPMLPAPSVFVRV